jgi:SAM-dependent methyltransferase
MRGRGRFRRCRLRVTSEARAPLSSERERVGCCPVCQDGDPLELFESHDWLYGRPGRFPLVRCNRCGLSYLRERPSPAALAGFYPDESYYAYRKPAAYSLFARRGLLASLWYALKRSVLAQRFDYRHLAPRRMPAAPAWIPLPSWLRERLTYELSVLLHPFIPGGSLLEVGCGAGMYLDLMRALGWPRVVGVDFSARAVSQARDVLGLEVYCGELHDQRFPPDSFDAVSLSHTLEHVADPVGLLSEIRRVLKPGGRLAVIVPNGESLASRVFREHCLLIDTPRHLVIFTKRSLALAFGRAGLDLERLTTSASGAYQVALFSDSRRAGDPPAVYTNSEHRFALPRRLKAAALGAWEHALCAVGRPAGEELWAVARKAP